MSCYIILADLGFKHMSWDKVSRYTHSLTPLLLLFALCAAAARGQSFGTGACAEESSGTPAFTSVPDGDGLGGAPAGYLITGATTWNLCASFSLDSAEGDPMSIVSLKSSNSTTPFAPRRFIQFGTIFPKGLPWELRWLMGN